MRQDQVFERRSVFLHEVKSRGDCPLSSELIETGGEGESGTACH